MFDFVFFTILAILAEKRVSPRKNFVTEKIFDFKIFGVKYVFKHSESIPTKKIFSTKIFWLCHFFTILVILAEKNKVPRKKFYTGKNFRFWDFCFKIRFKAFWIDSDQKNFFDQIFLTVIFSLFLPFWPKNDLVQKIYSRENLSISWLSFWYYILKYSGSIPIEN